MPVPSLDLSRIRVVLILLHPYANASPTLPQPAPARARTLEAGKRWARLAQARAASRPGIRHRPPHSEGAQEQQWVPPSALVLRLDLCNPLGRSCAGMQLDRWGISSQLLQCLPSY